MIYKKRLREFSIQMKYGEALNWFIDRLPLLFLLIYLSIFANRHLFCARAHSKYIDIIRCKEKPLKVLLFQSILLSFLSLFVRVLISEVISKLYDYLVCFKSSGEGFCSIFFVCSKFPIQMQFISKSYIKFKSKET